MRGKAGWLSFGILMVGLAGAQCVPAAQITPVSLEEGSGDALLERYRPVLDQYYTALLEQWSVQEYEAAGLCPLCAYCTTPSQAGYWLEDVDNNGTEELLIGETDASGAYGGMFFQLYTLAGDTPVLMASSTEYSRCYLCTDGSVAVEESGASDAASWAYYTVDSDQAVLTLTETVFCGSADDGSVCWFYSGISTAAEEQLVPEEDAREVMAAREYETVAYRPFEDYAEL